MFSVSILLTAVMNLQWTVTCHEGWRVNLKDTNESRSGAATSAVYFKRKGRENKQN